MNDTDGSRRNINESFKFFKELFMYLNDFLKNTDYINAYFSAPRYKIYTQLKVHKTIRHRKLANFETRLLGGYIPNFDSSSIEALFHTFVTIYSNRQIIFIEPIFFDGSSNRVNPLSPWHINKEYTPPNSAALIKLNYHR